MHVLGIDEHWNLDRLRYEAEHLAGVDSDNFATQESLGYLASLLAEMDTKIQDLEKQGLDKNEYLEPLKRVPMLPIRLANSPRLFNRLATAADAEEWFIADREVLLNAFLASAPLFALTLDHTVKSGRLLSALGLDSRRLSKTSLTFSKTNSKESTKNAAWWKARAEYIDR